MTSAECKVGVYILNQIPKGPVKLMQPVKISHSVLQSVSNTFHFVILNSPIWLSKNFLKPTTKMEK